MLSWRWKTSALVAQPPVYHFDSSLLPVLVVLCVGAEFLFDGEGRAVNSVLCNMPLESTRPGQHFSYFYFNIEISPLTFCSSV